MQNQRQVDNITRRRRTNRNILVIAAVALVAIVALGILGNFVGGDDADTTAEKAAPVRITTTEIVAPSAPVAPAPSEANSSTSAPSETQTVASPPPATESAYSDPRCAPAGTELIDRVAAGLTTEGHTLANGTVIHANGVTYFGATTVDAMGDMDARSDVWIVRDGAVYSSTGGARGGTSFPRADEVLGVSPGDPIVTAVDTCVIDLTR